MSRLILFPLVFAGSILVNQAGAIRSYIASNNSSVIGALTADEITDRSGDKDFYELGSGVSDVAIATWTGQYDFVAPIYNNLVNLYVPAFIVGHDIKDGLKVDTTDDDAADVTARFVRGGATRTGFSDSFQSLHYFGCLIFLAISLFMGTLWTKARSGDVKAQLYYMVLLSAGLKVFTESTSVFFGVLPLILGSLGGVFWYARRGAPVAMARETTRALAPKETV